MLSTSSGWKTYTNNTVSGGRAHLGDVYNHYGLSPDAQALQSILNSLRYDGMDDRRNFLASHERGTFDWAMAEEVVKSTSASYGNDRQEGPKSVDTKFATWLREEKEDGNLFCFMGKPGSGKSVFMYAYVHIRGC